MFVKAPTFWSTPSIEFRQTSSTWEELLQQKLISFPFFNTILQLSKYQINVSLELRKTGQKIFSVKKETFWQLGSGIEFGTLANGEELFSHPPFKYK